MAERRAQSKYYPPDWDPSKGSVNTFVGQHPLRDRARKLGEGILIVRFELPFNIWCGGCNAHIALGVRFNAEKKQIGKYYSTPILSFRMKCHLCSNWFEIQTDPKTSNYIVTSGARRKNQEYSTEDIQLTTLVDETERKSLDTDPMYRLEHGIKDTSKAAAIQTTIEDIIALSDSRKDNFDLNSMLRKKFRSEKTVLKAEAAEKQEFQQRKGLSIPVVSSIPKDSIEAHKAFNSIYSSFASSSSSSSTSNSSTVPASVQLKKIEAQSIFANAERAKAKATTQISTASSISTSTSTSTSTSANSNALAALERMKAAGVKISQKRAFNEPSSLLVSSSISNNIFSKSLVEKRKL